MTHTAKLQALAVLFQAHPIHMLHKMIDSEYQRWVIPIERKRAKERAKNTQSPE